MIEIEMQDGYPTEASLEAIKKWSPDDWQGKTLGEVSRPLLEAVKDAWYYDDRAKEPRPGLFTFSTGGWSGNEDLLGALRSNVLIYANWDYITLPGGLFCIAISEEAKLGMNALKSDIVDWCWAEVPLQKIPADILLTKPPSKDSFVDLSKPEVVAGRVVKGDTIDPMK